MRLRRPTLVLVALTLLVFVLSLPGWLRDALARGEIYLFSSAFLHDIPLRLTGPGRFRFVLQPLTAIVLGIRNGLADARAGRPPYLEGLLFCTGGLYRVYAPHTSATRICWVACAIASSATPATRASTRTLSTASRRSP
jgi:hypothetical protein